MMTQQGRSTARIIFSGYVVPMTASGIGAHASVMVAA